MPAPVYGRCLVCGAVLDLEPVRERCAVRCTACQARCAWPGSTQSAEVDPDTAIPSLPVLATPRHRVGRVCGPDGVWVLP